ncbi:MAG: tRNA (adenosine(37)-N6)-dimethylallyltransferase MiaA [Magnetococcales bacterium]|nr:tRNA (adenosine(37)-N6)-dimethylallyltransferase MiaA [Magnetococcales bacterium]
MTVPCYNLLAIIGATASGKTRLGVELARSLSGEIISADSRQVYRGLDIGTGKDLHEYGSVPYHLVDIVDPQTEFNVFDFQGRCYQSIRSITERGNLPCLVGGSGLYLESILMGYPMTRVPENPTLRLELALLDNDALQQRLETLKPRLHNSTDLTTRARMIRAIEIAASETPTPTPFPLHSKVLGIRWARTILRQRIQDRLRYRLDNGLIEEGQHLLCQGMTHERMESMGLEYRWVSRYLRKEITIQTLQTELGRAIAQFAKRQETWFRRMERRGITITWLEGGDTLSEQAQEACAQIEWLVT